MSSYPFNYSAVLKYLGLPEGYALSPKESPLEFLSKHFEQLPPQLLQPFSTITTPLQRAKLTPIRNRRLQYALSLPTQLGWEDGHKLAPMLWEGDTPGTGRPGQKEGQEEMEWAKGGFLGGFKGHVGKIGEILSEYEEEREAESARTLRRERMAKKAQEESAVQEEEDDSDECGAEAGPEPSDKEKKRAFERLLREQFIAGRVDSFDYDSVDYDERWDPDGKDEEDRWFDEEEEGE